MIDFNKMVKILNAKVLCNNEHDTIMINGGYVCDMISRVISTISEGQAWITILNSRNVIAAATICDCRSIILAESVIMESQLLEIAKTNRITVISTDLSAYDICVALSDELRK